MLSAFDPAAHLDRQTARQAVANLLRRSAVLVLYETRGAVAILCLHVLLPHFGPLDDMAVGIDHQTSRSITHWESSTCFVSMWTG